ncbi:MAG: molybdate ABC transporter permease subunit [Planctomycetota bacterium]
MDLVALRLTLQLAFCTTAVLLVIGLPLAHWLVHSRRSWKWVIDAVVSLPLVLPPTVLGFYLLWTTSRRSLFGQAYESLTGHMLPFTFAGILLASVLYNLPFAVRPFVAAFSAVDRRLLEAAWCLGSSRWRTFWRVSLPLARPGILTGMILTFAHTVGEFGVVLMVGGNIPGVTRTLSIAIFEDVDSLNYAAAGQTSLVLLAFAFLMLALVHALQKRMPQV